MINSSPPPVAALPLLVAVVGPTAVGKTATAIALAQAFDTAIVSADARQFYREMSVGTAAPTAAELAAAQHHFIHSHSIQQSYSVGQYEQEALACLAQLFVDKPVVVLVGGSGLYVKALCEGLDNLPPIPPEIRVQLQQRLEAEGLESLVAELAQRDPHSYNQIDRHNPQRVLRALEVCIGTGKPFSSFHHHQPKPRPFRVLYIGLDLPREQLYGRIDTRVEVMVAQGLEAEARRLYPYRMHNALQTVGYQEWYGYFEGIYDREEALRLLKRNSRRYAKRQLTWFRRIPEIQWFSPEQQAAILAYVQTHI